MMRSGVNTGPGRLRSTASSRPKARISPSARRNSRTLTQNFSTSLGSDSQKTGPFRNDCWKRDQPGALTTTKASSPKTTMVETSPIATLRPPSRPSPNRGPRAGRGGGAAATAGAPAPDRGRARGGGGGGGRARRRAGLVRVHDPLGLEDRGVRLVGEPLLGDRGELAAGLEPADRRVDARRQRAALVERDAVVLGF